MVGVGDNVGVALTSLVGLEVAVGMALAVLVGALVGVKTVGMAAGGSVGSAVALPSGLALSTGSCVLVCPQAASQKKAMLKINAVPSGFIYIPQGSLFLLLTRCYANLL
jgi:hypothetical protein